MFAAVGCAQPGRSTSTRTVSVPRGQPWLSHTATVRSCTCGKSLLPNEAFIPSRELVNGTRRSASAGRVQGRSDVSGTVPAAAATSAGVPRCSTATSRARRRGARPAMGPCASMRRFTKTLGSPVRPAGCERSVRSRHGNRCPILVFKLELAQGALLVLRTYDHQDGYR